MKLFGYLKTKKLLIIKLFGIKITHHFNISKLGLNDLYDIDFYEEQAKESYMSGHIILKKVYDLIPDIKSVLDVGCGVGTWLRAWKDINSDIDVTGIDANNIPSDKLYIDKSNIISSDLRKVSEIKLNLKKYDIVQSMEVAEHLPESVAKDFIHFLCGFSDLILFSAAIPLQGGGKSY